MSVRVTVLDDPVRACATIMLGIAIGGGDIVLTGGSSPRTSYELFAEWANEIGVDMSATTFWIGDERCVPPDDDRSNYRMIKESLLDRLVGPGEPTMHRIRGELGPDQGADDYAGTLAAAGSPTFDMVLLGLGPDGHCASLFPGQETLHERDRTVVGVPEAGLEPFVSRVSLTIPALTSGRQIVFLATGESKADAVAAAFAPDAPPDPSVPSSLLAPEGTPITVLLDRAAAARLPGSAR